MQDIIKQHVLDQPSVVVIIDQWLWQDVKTERQHDDSLAQKIINFIDCTPAIAVAVLASYNCSKELYSDTVWYSNTGNFFNHSLSYTNRTRYDYENNLGLKQSTLPVLLNYVNKNIHQIALRSWREMEQYLLKNSQLRNIYVVGSDWNICVKQRDLGFINLYKMTQGKNINILTNIDCVRDNNRSPDMSTETAWRAITDKIYQYCPD